MSADLLQSAAPVAVPPPEPQAPEIPEKFRDPATGELRVEAGEDLVLGKPAFHEQLLSLQREPLKLRAGCHRPRKRLLEEHGCRSNGQGQGPHPLAAGQERLTGRITVIHREFDGGLLHGPIGLHDHRLPQGDVLLVVEPLDVGGGPTLDAKRQFQISL